MAFERRITKQPPKGNSDSPTIEYENLEPGEYEARLVYIVDLGMHRKEYKGEYTGDQQMIVLGFEILGETVTVDGKEHPRYMFINPFYVSPAGMSEKSNEYKYYSVFEPTAKDWDTPDWPAQLGKPCSVMIENVKSKDGDKVFDNIVSVTAIPKKYQKNVAKGKLKPEAGDGNDLEDKLYGLARWIWDRRIGAGGETQQETPKKKDAPAEDDDFDDDIPF